MFSFYSLLLLCLVIAGSKARRSALCRPADTICLPSSPLPRPLPSFPFATELFFLHVFRFRRHSVFGHRLFSAVFKILSSACGTAACFGFIGSEPWVLLLLLPGLRCFWVFS
jgi:hypothetical protein